MSADQLEQGKLIVEAMIREEAQRFGLSLTVRWLPHQGDDFERGLHSLECIASGKRSVERFAEEELSDVGNDAAMRRSLKGRVRALLASF